MRDIILVFIGGGLGSVVRFALARWINSFHTPQFPFGTLIVNVVACFVLGAIVGLADQRQLITPVSRLFWAVGFCGGFSTFSTFSYDTILLIQSGVTISAVLYIVLSLVICIGATLGGIYVGEHSF